MDATITRLVELRQEYDRLTVKNGTDPDRNPVRAVACGSEVFIRCDGQPLWIVRRGRVYSHRTGGLLGTVADQVRFWETKVAKARANGEVEYAEKQRLNAIARTHALTGWYERPNYDLLRHLTRIGHVVQFRTANTAKARREVAELRSRLKSLTAA